MLLVSPIQLLYKWKPSCIVVPIHSSVLESDLCLSDIHAPLLLILISSAYFRETCGHCDGILAINLHVGWYHVLVQSASVADKFTAVLLYQNRLILVRSCLYILVYLLLYNTDFFTLLLTNYVIHRFLCFS